MLLDTGHPGPRRPPHALIIPGQAGEEVGWLVIPVMSVSGSGRYSTVTVAVASTRLPESDQ